MNAARTQSANELVSSAAMKIARVATRRRRVGSSFDSTWSRVCFPFKRNTLVLLAFRDGGIVQPEIVSNQDNGECLGKQREIGKAIPKGRPQSRYRRKPSPTPESTWETGDPIHSKFFRRQKDCRVADRVASIRESPVSFSACKKIGADPSHNPRQ